MRHFSIRVVTKGQPRDSIALCACFCKANREIVKAGKATTSFASLMRLAIAAIAFCRAASLDRGIIGLTSVGTRLYVPSTK